MMGSGATRRTRKATIAGIVVLTLASLGIGLYALAAGLPAPTISSAPSNPSNQPSPSFTYTDQHAITRFECALDSPSFTVFNQCGTTRPSMTTYHGLAAGTHTFQVRAVLVSGSSTQTSPPTAYTWTIDLTPPHVVSMTQLDPDPTNASSVRWLVTFSESVTGVDATDFRLFWTGILGPFMGFVSGSGAVYTVSASTGFGSPGTLQLNLLDNDSIKDPAGNPLGGPGAGNGNYNGQMYHIDKIAPPAPQFTQKPPDPSSTPVSTFAWTDSATDVAYYQCQIESSGPWQTCTSPYTFTVGNTNDGQHQFAVRAVDTAGNVSPSASYSWKVSQPGFTISGIVTDFSAHPAALYPAKLRRIAITFTNPNSFSIDITSLTVTATTSPSGCSASTNLSITQSPLSSTHTFTVPAHSSATLTPTDDPQIQLIDLPTTNQDSCKGHGFGLQFGGMARH